MGSIYKGLFQGRWLPQLSLIRNKHKHNITKPRLPHFERHVVEHVCLPYFQQKRKPDHLADIDSCSGQKVVVKDNWLAPYLDMLAKECLERISSSKLVGFFHLNTRNSDDIFKAQVLLKKNGMKFTYYSRPIITRALTGTHYEPILQLFKGPTAMATMAEFHLPKLLKILKKMQKLVLMAALVEDRLVSFSELKYYGSYESLDATRVKLLQVLNSASQNLVHQISQHPNTLVQCLNQRIDNLKTNSSAS